MTPAVTIAIPAFNEAATIRRVVEAAAVHAAVLVVDDGSTDGTADEARAAGASVIRHPRRRGKGAALATAIRAARERGAARVITLDADGQHDPADVRALLVASTATPRAIIVGSRVGGVDAPLPRGRALAIHLAGFWVSWITGHGVADTQSGFRVYPGALFDEVRLRGGRFVFETAVLVDALERGWAVHEVPIRVVPYAARASRFNPLGDGVAITAYLTGRGLARWAHELAAGAREFASVFSRDRRTARHSRMLARISAHAGMPEWGAALGVAAAVEMRGGLTAWWHHPRVRRARRAALATLAAPAVIGIAAVTALTGGAIPGALDAWVRRLYDPRRLALHPATGDVHAGREQPWLEAAPR